MNTIGKIKYFRILSIVILTLAITGAVFSQQGEKRPENGSKAPEITCENMVGDCVALSELSGKMVLVEFWSSSNHTSMIDHAELEKVYSEFKDVNFKNARGFEVYSVALDDSEERWRMALVRDNNSWQYSMCNPNRWNSKAAMDYNIQTIPKYFLVDGNGQIIENLFLMKDLPNILAKYSSKVR